MKLYVEGLKTPIGRIHVAADDTKLLSIDLPPSDSTRFSEDLRKRYPEAVLCAGNQITNRTCIQVSEYLQGARKAFDLPVRLDVTAFQRRVLEAVGEIPYGATMAYSEVAEKIGSPKAARAVGTANARNPLPLVIPCHRVVARQGLGGFGGGLDLKQRLLALESGR
jgi:methylated-DNA-[protein]-cysteine S-methyltransferase